MYEFWDNIIQDAILPESMFSLICTKFLNVSSFSTWLFYWFKSFSNNVNAGSTSIPGQSQYPYSKNFVSLQRHFFLVYLGQRFLLISNYREKKI